MKNILFILFLFIFAPVPAQEPEWIPFQWVRSLLADRYIDQSAIRVPVRIDSLPHPFTMQLDLGTITTTFSGNAMDPYLETYPPLGNKLDTTQKFSAYGKVFPMLTGVELRLGTYVFKDLGIGYRKGYGRAMQRDSIFQKTNVRIGAIGADLFLDKILMIDFRRERFAIADSLPEPFWDLEFVPFGKERGRIKLPFRINGKQEVVLFDTGASSFALSTTKERALALSDSIITDSLKVPSWGQYLTLRGLNTNKPIYLGKQKLKETIVYYDETRIYDSGFAAEKVWGLTGNAYFLESTVVIDYRNHLFGVKWE